MPNRPDAAHGLEHVARCAVEPLMQAMDLHDIRRAKSPHTMHSALREQCPAGFAKRHFSAFGPNELWIATITYERTMSGWVYMAFMTDVFSRHVVRWRSSASLYTDLVLDTLETAVW